MANNTTSSLSDLSPWTISRHHVEAAVMPVIFAVIFITGLVGNGTLIFIIARYKKFHNAPNLMIMSLALGDLLLIAFSVPFVSTVYTFVAWPYGLVLCKLREFLRTLSMGVSIFTLTALSEERYVAIVHPLSIHKGSHMRRTLVIIAGIWLASLALAAIDAVASELNQYSEFTVICSPTPIGWGPVYEKIFPMFQFITFFAIPVLVIGVFYSLMACKLWKGGEEDAGLNPATKHLQARKNVAKVVLCFVLIFMVCWFPRHIYQLWWFYDESPFTDSWMVFKTIGYCLLYFNSCINPVALYILSHQFQVLFRKHLCCCCPRLQIEQGRKVHRRFDFALQDAASLWIRGHHHRKTDDRCRGIANTPQMTL